MSVFWFKVSYNMIFQIQYFIRVSHNNLMQTNLSIHMKIEIKFKYILKVNERVLILILFYFKIDGSIKKCK